MYRAYLVDDDRLLVCEAIKSIPWLENGFEVASFCTDPVLAVGEIIAMRPDVVFFDLKMPEMDGLTLMRQLKAADVGCEYVLLTGERDNEIDDKFFTLGGFESLRKPLSERDAAPVLERLYRLFLSRNNIVPTVVPIQTARRNFDNMIANICERPEKQYTLKSLSRRWGIGAEKICALLGEHYNLSLALFIKEVRMQKAARLFNTPEEIKTREMARICGYNDYYEFVKDFTVRYGMPPSKYRNILEEGNQGNGE